MKRAVLISCFDWYKGRLEIVRNYLLEKGYEVEVLLSDFNHIRKIKHIHKHSKCKYIHVIPYKKNISMTRIISHLMFGQSVKKYIKKYDPEFIYAVAPTRPEPIWVARRILCASPPESVPVARDRER